MSCSRRAVPAGERDRLLARIARKPDLTLRAIVAELAARDVRVSYDAVWRFCRRAGMAFKKACAPPGGAGRTWPGNGVARKRQRWHRQRHRPDPRRPVFIDMCSSTKTGRKQT